MKREKSVNIEFQIESELYNSHLINEMTDPCSNHYRFFRGQLQVDTEIV